MFSLYLKEINSFFSSLTAYIVVIVFMLTTSLFLWVFPGNLNILSMAYASLDPMFTIAPWIFLFLVPAITMKLIADEKMSGTIELLLTKPLTEMHIILAKYLAGVSLVLLSLLPVLVYYYSVYQLGYPVGNLDKGGILGSSIGLFFLAAIYVAIGIFASSLSRNQVISFIVAMLLCFFFYSGFDYIAAFFGPSETFIVSLGINAHYGSMSRGVIDSRDILYFASVIALFLYSTNIILQSRKW